MDRLTNKVASHERKLRALELRKAAVPYQQIADELGYRSASGAFNAVKAALKATLREPAEELRELELARLDAMLLPLWRRVQRGDEKAIDRALRIMERRARLLGLDAPTRGQLSGPDGKPLALDLSGLSEEQLDLLEIVHAQLAPKSR
jgi:hypothetical protein